MSSASSFLHQVSSGWAPIPWIATISTDDAGVDFFATILQLEDGFGTDRWAGAWLALFCLLDGRSADQIYKEYRQPLLMKDWGCSSMSTLVHSIRGVEVGGEAPAKPQ